jgi:RNA polymerase sigma factor (TIGR02999 family)
MADVTGILKAAGAGDPAATAALLPLLYDELRRMAAGQLAREKSGHTLQATALVHEAFLRLVGPDPERQPAWNSRGHFFAAAAEAMRRILVESARRRQAAKRGGGVQPLKVDECLVAAPADDDELLAVHEVLDQLAATDPQAAELVKLRFFAGLKTDEVAELLGISVRGAHDVWAYARAWLKERLGRE